MASVTNQPQTPDDPPNEPTPETADASEGAGIYAPGNKLEFTPKEEPAPAEGEEAEGPKPFVDTKRNAIFAKAKAQRQGTEFSGSQHDKAVLYGSNINTEGVSEAEKAAFGQPPAEQPAPQQQQPAPQQGAMRHIDPDLQQRKVTVIVDGQPREVTIEDALRNYQINEAATARLEQANRLLAAVKETTRAPANQPAPQQVGQDAPANQPPAIPDYLKTTIEKIQFGSPEEGAAALQEAFGRLAQQNAQPVFDPTENIMARLELHQEDRKAENEIEAYAKANPDVADPVLQKIIGDFSTRGMVDDLLQHMPIDQLKQLVPDQPSLIQLHARARAAGAQGVRSAGQLLTAAHQQAKAWRTGGQQQPTQQPAPGLAQRQERKQNLTTQPAERRQAPTPPNQQPRTQEQSRTDAVAKMRAARGQAV